MLRVFLLFLVFLFGCETTYECGALCNKIDEWSRACNIAQDMSQGSCIKHFSSVYQEMIAKDRKTCWSKLTKWIVENNGEQLDCSKPPPVLADLEKGIVTCQEYIKK